MFLTCRTLSSLYPTAPPDALDLLSKLLQFNPEKRATIEQAISHPYMAQFHNLAEVNHTHAHTHMHTSSSALALSFSLARSPLLLLLT